jgi:hypothetical protein
VLKTVTRLSVLLAFVLSVSSPVLGQAITARGDWIHPQFLKEAQEHAEFMWSKILTRCGDSYYYDGSGLDNVTTAGTPLPYNNGRLDGFTEYQGVQMYLLPPSGFTAGDAGTRLFDGEWALAVMISTRFRTGTVETARLTEGGWLLGPVLAKYTTKQLREMSDKDFAAIVAGYAIRSR